MHQPRQRACHVLVVHIEVPGLPAGLYGVPQLLGDDGGVMAVQERPPVRRIIDDFLLPVGADTGLHGIGLIPADLADIDRVIQNQADGVPIEAAAAPAM